MIEPKDQILCAWGECASDPGWANHPLWVIVRSREGELRQECVQPGEQSVAMRLLFKISAVVNMQMISAIEEWRRKA